MLREQARRLNLHLPTYVQSEALLLAAGASIAQEPAQVRVRGTIEAVEMPGRWVVGVQWHPEDSADTDGEQQRLFAALLHHT